MRLLRIPLTVLLGLFLLGDVRIVILLRHYAPPREVTSHEIRSGVYQLLLQPAPKLTSFDWFILGIFALFQIGLCYLVRRAWKATGAR